MSLTNSEAGMTSDASGRGERKRAGDALSFLMQSAKSKSKPLKLNLSVPRFTLCPAGCGKHYLPENMNQHLDACLKTMPQAAAAADMTPDKGATDMTMSNAVTQTPMDPSVSQEDDNMCKKPDLTQDASEVTERAGRSDDKPKENDTTHGTMQNAFTCMLQNSRRIFSDHVKPAASIPQFFHLAQDGQVYISSEPRQQLDLHKGWTANVTLKNGQGRPIELTISCHSTYVESTSSMPSQSIGPFNARFVRKHSKLSVPVLKSILQKSVRRHRPLAAVLVAMELADKSLADLLRRLPIIMLEDSTLHPRLGLVVWTMMAHSKGFEVPRALMTEIFRIIYDIAHCRFRDAIEGNGSADRQPTEEAEGSTPALDDFSALDGNGDHGRLLVWSMLARAKYGGMRCDVLMLNGFAQLWKSRLDGGAVPSELLGRLKNTGSTTSWANVLEAIYPKSSRDLSLKTVADVLGSGSIEKLRLSDICIEGVDFHCSPVLENILSNDKLVNVCLDLLRLSPNKTQLESRERLKGILESSMWTFSSGVNFREQLLPQSVDIERKTSDYSTLWKELIEPEARRFQLQYVKQRLS